MKTIGFTAQLKQITGSGWRVVYIVLFLLSASSLAQAEQPALRTWWNENLGIFWVQASEALAHDLAISEKSTLVTGVSAGSAADKAGVKRGDIILRSDVWNTPGESGRMEISRGGEKLNLDITSQKHNILNAKLAGDTTSRAQPKTIVVDQAGKGDYRTITGAMIVAAFGDTLLIRDGIYREEISFTSGITVQGTETGGARVESNFPFRIIGSQGVTIRGLTLRGTMDGLIIWNAEKTAVHDCNILTEKNTGINIQGSSEVLVQGCSLSGKDETKGIVVEESQAKLADNMISQYGLGIMVKKSSRADISHNLLDANGDGLAAYDSQITAKKNTITGKGDGIGIYFQNSQAAIEENHIRKYNTGINAERAQGQVVGNTVSQNDLGMMLGQVSLEISENLILNNKRHGIQLYGDEAALLDASQQATIAQNTITGNGAYGIQISDFKAEIYYNLIEANGGGITVEQSNTNIRNNTIVLQSVFGIQISPNSQAGIYNNIVAFNSLGIDSDVSSLLKMGCNDVYGNFATKSFPVLDGNYLRRDRLITRGGEKIHIMVCPAYDLKADTDLTKDPRFVKLGSDYRPAADSPLAKKKGKDGAFIGAFPPSD